MSDIVKTEIIDNVALLTLNDPDRLNALSLDMIAELHKNIILINTLYYFLISFKIIGVFKIYA